MEKLESIVSKVVGTGLILGTIYLGAMSIFGGQKAREQIAEAFKSTTSYNHSSEKIDEQFVRELRETYRITQKD